VVKQAEKQRGKMVQNFTVRFSVTQIDFQCFEFRQAEVLDSRAL